MNTEAESDTRILNVAELDMVNATRSPEIEALSPDELKSIGRRLRALVERRAAPTFAGASAYRWR